MNRTYLRHLRWHQPLETSAPQGFCLRRPQFCLGPTLPRLGLTRSMSRKTSFPAASTEPGQLASHLQFLASPTIPGLGWVAADGTTCAHEFLSRDTLWLLGNRKGTVHSRQVLSPSFSSTTSPRNGSADVLPRQSSHSRANLPDYLDQHIMWHVASLPISSLAPFPHLPLSLFPLRLWRSAGSPEITKCMKVLSEL